MSERQRPLVHFTPQKNWINDPNGLILHKGLYHLYFQHNPHGDRHGNMSWGHATSSDLVHWNEHPVALLHDDVHDVFSGSVVWDEHNTSELGPSTGPGPLVAIYTAAARSGDHQAQAVAFSTDDGFTWTRFEGNPVLDLGTDDFRDPKVFRYEGPSGSWWVMVAVEARSRRVILHRSDDLLHWDLLSRFGPAGAIEGLWECPDLFPLHVEGEPGTLRWILLVSVSTGGVAGGTGTQYFVGGFDGVTFTPETPVPPVPSPGDALSRLSWLDHGKDCYAGVTFSGTPINERIIIAWMSNWDYAQDIPTSPWRGSMTIPRRLTLTGPEGARRLRQTPLLPQPREIALADEQSSNAGRVQLFDELPLAALIELSILCRDQDDVVLELSDEHGSSLRMVLSSEQRTLTMQRQDRQSLEHGWETTHSARLLSIAPAIQLSVVLDTDSVEVFAEGGRAVLTDLVLLGARRRLDVRGAGRGQVRRASVARLD